jgi:GPH family glycoside/pentoside/hexuronide:cation symporter
MNFWKKLAYSFGSMGAGLPENAFTAWALYLYVDKLGFPQQLFASAMLIYTIWNCINDPLFGFWSDRTHTRWGRRIPYIVLGTLPLALAFYLIWAPPVGVSHMALFWYYLAVIFAYDGFYTLVIINWTSLYPETFTSTRDRSTVNAWRQAIGILGAMAGLAATPLIVARLGWKGMGVIFGAITAISIFVSLLGSREDVHAPGEALPLGPAIRNTLANRSFLTFVIFNLFVNSVTVLVPQVIPFFAKYVLHISDSQSSLIMAPIFVVAIVSQVLWAKVVVRRGVRTTAVIACILFGLSLLPLGLVRTMTQAVIGFAIVGIGLGALLLVGDIMVADICDEDSLTTHTRREGMFYGVNALIIRMSVAISAGTISLVQTVTGYKPVTDPTLMAPAAVVGFRLLVSVVPAVLIGLGLIFVFLYPLYGARLARVKRLCSAGHGGERSTTPVSEPEVLTS